MAGKRSGYQTLPDGALGWVPYGWPYTPVHRLSPPGVTDSERTLRAREHAKRILQLPRHPPDFPPFLIGYSRGRKTLPWRCVRMVDGYRGESTWHATRAEAIAAGETVL